jgi:hypothetical protein
MREEGREYRNIKERKRRRDWIEMEEEYWEEDDWEGIEEYSIII